MHLPERSPSRYRACMIRSTKPILRRNHAERWFCSAWSCYNSIDLVTVGAVPRFPDSSLSTIVHLNKFLPASLVGWERTSALKAVRNV